MAEAIKMPLMSDTMTEGVIVEWHKKVGDKIESGDLIADVETDKATMPMESYSEGTLLYIGAKEGEAVPVNSIVAIVGEKGEDFQSLLNQEKSPEKKEAAPAAEEKSDKTSAPKADLPDGVKEILMPLLSDTMKEGTIVKWNKKVGDAVASDDALAEVETDKATMEIIGYEEGTLLYIAVEEGAAAPINDVVALVGPKGTDVKAYVEYLKSKPKKSDERADNTVQDAAPEPQPVQSPQSIPVQDTAPTAVIESEGGRVKASPLAKKMAKDLGYNLSQIPGSGDGGRIVKRDVENYVPSAQPAIATSQPAAATDSSAPAKGVLHMHSFAPTGQESYDDIANSQMRKTIARRLSESKFQAPHFYLTMEINMDNAMKARKAMNEVSPVKISFNDIVIKACAMALREHPAVNSSWMGDFIRQNHHIHIGSAVAVAEGLIVPVIRFADQKSLSLIAAEAKELYGKARDKKLQPAEFSGNTFTISNLGMMDIDEFTAVINPPDSAILAVGKIKEVVVKKGDGFGVVNVMKVTLSCDHRSVDGAVGAKFLQTVKAFIENPVRMLI